LDVLEEKFMGISEEPFSKAELVVDENVVRRL
jgi:hypothetical protein